MRKRTFAFLILSAIAVCAEPPPFAQADFSASPRIAALRKQIEAGDASAVAQFWAELSRRHAPLIEENAADHRSSLVTFVWQAKEDTRNVAVVVDGFTEFDVSANQMTRLGTTDLWYKTYVLRNDARWMYQFALNDLQQRFKKLEPKDIAGWIRLRSMLEPDPYNPQKFDWRLTHASYVELPGTPPQLWIAPLDNIPKGVVEEKKLRSDIQKNERTVWVYTPPGFIATADSYPLLVIFDGEDYLNTIGVPAMLDNLIAQRRIPPIVAIMIGEAGFSRFTDLACSTPFTEFLAKEAIPWMRENYRATSRPEYTMVGGASLGGLAASCAALRHSEVFGNVFSQSGSFGGAPDDDPEPEWLARQLAASPKLPVRFFLEAGLMEIARPRRDDEPSLLVASRHMRDVLTAGHYAIRYQEFNGGHSYLNWRSSFADAIVFLAH